ncbi:MAG: hypothetical protein HYW07_18915 [Candidatus Latescibacteria bacterium]|nr:hypothetical protein [Candidatus Latescibacterota bacterium]
METTIELPTDLKIKAEQAAQARGGSLSDFVRESLEWVLAQTVEDDPLFADNAVYSGKAPKDLAARHDEYLYGEGA